MHDAGFDRDSPADIAVPTGMAGAKFCNELTKGAAGMTVELTLGVGLPPVRMSALSNRCSPVLGQACTSIPAGSVQVELLDGNVSIARANFSIPANREVVFVATLDNTTGAPAIDGRLLRPDVKCAAADTLGPVDGGAPPDAAGGGGMCAPYLTSCSTVGACCTGLTCEGLQLGSGSCFKACNVNSDCTSAGANCCAQPSWASRRVCVSETNCTPGGPGGGSGESGNVLASHRDTHFAIGTTAGDRVFQARTFCSNLERGDKVRFSSEVATCTSNTFTNERTGRSCDVWCETSAEPGTILSVSDTLITATTRLGTRSFEPKVGCQLRMIAPGDRVLFADRPSVCVSNLILDVSSGGTCDVWCR